MKRKAGAPVVAPDAHALDPFAIVHASPERLTPWAVAVAARVYLHARGEAMTAADDLASEWLAGRA
jgi:hypothetical protein